uniref:FecR domain-containing protein n=1 Tax=Roseihalotalea indica TaxID=2867963 RepID=A0AA49JG91_9BACT|nr:FecR domain-containing protein [Tunicatimonas sp. TK19036]
MNKNQFLHLLDKYMKGESTAEESDLLFRFYDSFQEDASMGQMDAFDAYLKQEQIHRRIRQHVAETDRKEYQVKRQKTARFYSMLKIAAVIVLLLSVGLGSYIAYENTPEPEIAWIEKTTRKGQKATITLMDGSKVYLNVDSKLSFPEQFSPDKREVILEGEAFFEVAKNAKRPFTIKSGDLTTTVLGTSFNIKAFEEEPVSVTVATGKVKVQAMGQDSIAQEVFLLPDQQALYDGHLSQKDVDIKPFISWREKVLHFDETSLEEVVAVLERWFNVSIVIENDQLRDCEISAQYIDENLLNVMKSLEHVLGVEYRIEGENKVFISGQKCTSQKL